MLARSLTDFGPEAEDVPAQRAGLLHREIGEAGDVPEFQDARVETSENGAPAFGAEVECEKVGLHVYDSFLVGASGLPGPKCFSMTRFSVALPLVTTMPFLAASAVTKSSSLVIWP